MGRFVLIFLLLSASCTNVSRVEFSDSGGRAFVDSVEGVRLHPGHVAHIDILSGVRNSVDGEGTLSLNQIEGRIYFLEEMATKISARGRMDFLQPFDGDAAQFGFFFGIEVEW